MTTDLANLELPAECVRDLTGQGAADDVAEYWRAKLNFAPERAAASYFIRESGGWDADEIAAMDDSQVNRLALWVAAGYARAEMERSSPNRL